MGDEWVTPQREHTEESSSRPRRQVMEAESVEIPLGMPSRESKMGPLWALTNQFSKFEGSLRTDPSEDTWTSSTRINPLGWGIFAKCQKIGRCWVLERCFFNLAKNQGLRDVLGTLRDALTRLCSMSLCN